MPTRYLKAEICDSETLDSLSPLAEVLFYRLLVSVDDFGRLDARSSFVKAKCFPVRESVSAKDTEKLLVELHGKGVITLYSINDRRYLQMAKWTNKPRSETSKYPQMQNECIQVYTDEKQCKANPPETETETETVTRSSERNVLFPEIQNRQLVDDWKKIRKEKKMPITETAINLFIAEVEKSGWTLEQVLMKCCEKSWGGFKANWLREEQKPSVNGEFDINEWLKTK